MVVGSAGASLEKGDFDPSLGNFSLKHVNDWGYIRLDANRSRLRVEFVRTRAWSPDGADAPEAEAAMVEASGESRRRMPPGSVWDEVEILPWV